MVRMYELYIVKPKGCKLGNGEQYRHDSHFLEVPKEMNEYEGQREPHDAEKRPHSATSVTRVPSRSTTQVRHERLHMSASTSAHWR